jgi:hypothetical protein
MKYKYIKLMTFSALLVLTSCGGAGKDSDQSTLNTDDSGDILSVVDLLNPNEVIDDITYLSSPALGGRGPATEGGRLAEQFVSDKFREIGLEPYKDGSYFQPYLQNYTKVPVKYFSVYTYEEGTTNRHDYEYAFDYTVVPNFVSKKVDLDLDLSLDLADASLTTAVLTSSSEFYYQDKSFHYLAYISDSYFPSLEYGQGEYYKNTQNEFSLYISNSMKSQLEADFANNMRKLHVSWEYDTSAKTVNNVVGILKGGKATNDNHIIISSHLDHVGRFGEKENQYFPGALDNASGTAGIIHLAKIYASIKDELTTNIVFVANNGEEGGLYGSTNYPYYAYEQAVREVAGRPRILVNLDMIGSESDENSGLELIGKFSVTAKGRIENLLEKYNIQNYKFGANSPVSDQYEMSKYLDTSFTIDHYDERFYHTPLDTVDHIDSNVLLKHLSLATDFIGFYL